MGPYESLSKDLSNKYQCYMVSITSKIFIFLLFSDFGDRSRPPSLKGFKVIHSQISMENKMWSFTAKFEENINKNLTHLIGQFAIVKLIPENWQKITLKCISLKIF
jgi:hypothetical protein